MNTENPIILSPDEIVPKMLITIVDNEGEKNRFLVLEQDPKNKAKFYGQYERYLILHPESITIYTARLVLLSFINNHKELRHTTPNQKKAFKDIMIMRMDEYIKDHPGRFLLSNKLAKELIESL
jgi:hypothetical protein